MKKALSIIGVIALVSCGGSVNECPTGPYKKHSWSMESAATHYYIQKCDYCDRHRRVNDDGTYDYENMEDGALSIHLDKSVVKE